MDTLRYVVALLLIVAVPAAIGYWLLIHPLARFWRRRGPTTAYAVVLPLVGALMAGMVSLRHRLLGADCGLSPPLALAGLGFLLVSGVLLRRLRRKLTLGTLVGVPELSATPGGLITDGMYARVRHPRYVQMTLAILGYALIANFPAAYGALLFWCAGIYAVVLLEERELAARFGAAWEDYCRRVPRFIPRLRHPRA
ncbi:MAG TPA: isoprenylcysteine carboxylmethyltransferase family protein [Geobacteraceae bacterium]